jgi:nitrite transporter NirC
LCLFAFITAGFEYSVATMTLLSPALMLPHKAGVSIERFAYNLTSVTLGNIVGVVVWVGMSIGMFLKKYLKI